MEYVQEVFSSHANWVVYEALPATRELYDRLQVPTWSEYSLAIKTSLKDFYNVSQSAWKVLYLTFRPMVILALIVLQVVATLGRFLFQNLLAHGWISLQKGATQAKTGLLLFYRFQSSLTRYELLGEIGLCITIVCLYYLRRWFQQQTYIAKAAQWYRRHKRKTIQVRLGERLFDL